jgi:hypothetical protein
MVHLVSQLERDSAISAVERERRLRHAAEDATAAAHGMAAAVIEAEHMARDAAISHAKAEVSKFHEDLHRKHATSQIRAGDVASSAAARAADQIGTLRQQFSNEVTSTVAQRAATLSSQERAAAEAEAKSMSKVAAMYQAPSSSGVSSRASSVGTPSRDREYGRAQRVPAGDDIAAAAERVSMEAVDMGSHLVQREMAILKAEIERAASLHNQVAATAISHVQGGTSSPAKPLAQPGRPAALSRPGSRNHSRGSSAGRSPSQEVAPAPSLGAQQQDLQRAAMMNRERSRAAGVATSAAAPSLGSRQRDLRGAAAGPTHPAARTTHALNPRAGRFSAEAAMIVSGVPIEARGSKYVTVQTRVPSPIASPSPPVPEARSGRHAIRARHVENRRLAASRGSRQAEGYVSSSSGSPLSQRPLDDNDADVSSIERRR